MVQAALGHSHFAHRQSRQAMIRGGKREEWSVVVSRPIQAHTLACLLEQHPHGLFCARLHLLQLRALCVACNVRERRSVCVCLCLCESKVNVTREHSIVCMTTTIFFDGIIWVYYGTGVQKKMLCKKSRELWGEKLAREREKRKYDSMHKIARKVRGGDVTCRE